MRCPLRLAARARLFTKVLIMMAALICGAVDMTFTSGTEDPGSNPARRIFAYLNFRENKKMLLSVIDLI
jgi:hypothetical protein